MLLINLKSDLVTPLHLKFLCTRSAILSTSLYFSLEISCIRVPPQTTLRSCSPPQIPSIGLLYFKQSLHIVISKDVLLFLKLLIKKINEHAHHKIDHMNLILLPNLCTDPQKRTRLSHLKNYILHQKFLLN